MSLMYGLGLGLGLGLRLGLGGLLRRLCVTYVREHEVPVRLLGITYPSLSSGLGSGSG